MRHVLGLLLRGRVERALAGIQNDVETADDARCIHMGLIRSSRHATALPASLGLSDVEGWELVMVAVLVVLMVRQSHATAWQTTAAHCSILEASCTFIGPTYSRGRLLPRCLTTGSTRLSIRRNAILIIMSLKTAS